MSVKCFSVVGTDNMPASFSYLRYLYFLFVPVTFLGLVSLICYTQMPLPQGNRSQAGLHFVSDDWTNHRQAYTLCLMIEPITGRLTLCVRWLARAYHRQAYIGYLMIIINQSQAGLHFLSDGSTNYRQANILCQMIGLNFVQSQAALYQMEDRFCLDFCLFYFRGKMVFFQIVHLNFDSRKKYLVVVTWHGCFWCWNLFTDISIYV